MVHDLVAGILAVAASANVVVLGDLNDCEFSETVAILEGGPQTILTDLMDTLPATQRYSYVFEANSQTLDHILVSRHLLAAAVFEPVHVNAEYWDQASHHDPSVARVDGGGQARAGVFGAVEIQASQRRVPP